MKSPSVVHRPGRNTLVQCAMCHERIRILNIPYSYAIVCLDCWRKTEAMPDMLTALEAAGFLIAAGPMSDYVESILSQINNAIDKAKGKEKT